MFNKVRDHLEEGSLNNARGLVCYVVLVRWNLSYINPRQPEGDTVTLRLTTSTNASCTKNTSMKAHA